MLAAKAKKKKKISDDHFSGGGAGKTPSHAQEPCTELSNLRGR